MRPWLTCFNGSQDLRNHIAWVCLKELLHVQDAAQAYAVSIYASYNASGTEVDRPIAPSVNQVLQNRYLSWTSDVTITLTRARNLFAALDNDIRKVENRPPEAVGVPLAGRFIGSYGIWQLDRALRLYYESSGKDVAANRLKEIKAEVHRLEKRRERIYSLAVRSKLEAELNRLSTVELPERDRLRWDEIADQKTKEVAQETGYAVRAIVAEFASRAGLGVHTYTGLPNEHRPGRAVVEFAGRFMRREVMDCRPGVFDDAGTWTCIDMTGTRCYVTVSTYTKYTTLHEMTEQVGKSIPWSKVVQHEWNDINPFELTVEIVNWCEATLDKGESMDVLWHNIRAGATRGATPYGPINASIWSGWLSTLPVDTGLAVAKVMSAGMLVDIAANAQTPGAFRNAVVRRLLGHCGIAYSPALAMPRYVPAALVAYIRPDGDGAPLEPDVLDHFVAAEGVGDVFAKMFKRLTVREASKEGETVGASPVES